MSDMVKEPRSSRRFRYLDDLKISASPLPAFFFFYFYCVADALVYERFAPLGEIEKWTALFFFDRLVFSEILKVFL